MLIEEKGQSRSADRDIWKALKDIKSGEDASPLAAANTEVEVDAAAALRELSSAKGEPRGDCSSGSGGTTPTRPLMMARGRA